MIQITQAEYDDYCEELIKIKREFERLKLIENKILDMLITVKEDYTQGYYKHNLVQILEELLK